MASYNSVVMVQGENNRVLQYAICKGLRLLVTLALVGGIAADDMLVAFNC